MPDELKTVEVYSLAIKIFGLENDIIHFIDAPEVKEALELLHY